MKKYLLPLALLLCLASAAAMAKPVKITGQLQNAGSHSKIYLYQYRGVSKNLYDSSALQNGSFSFQFRKELPRGMYFIGSTPQQGFDLVLGNESFSLTGDLSQPASSLRTTGSAENETLQALRDFNQQMNREITALNQKMMAANSYAQTDPTRYQQEMNRLNRQSDSLTEVQNKQYELLARKHKNLFMNKVLHLFILPKSRNESNFFSKEELNDEELWRGDMLVQKLNVYFGRYFNPADTDSQREAAMKLVALTPAGSEQRELLYEGLANVFRLRNQALTAQMVKQYNSDFPKSKTAQNMAASLPASPPAVGDMAPDIELATPDGKTMALSSLKGQVVLLDFWASWCGPCRRENPNVVRAFQKYKDRGFTIFGVSLDHDRNRWLQAIDADKLTWHHVSDLKGWQSAGAARYSVRSIPATYLIDKNGKIVAMNLRGDALERKLEEVLKK